MRMVRIYKSEFDDPRSNPKRPPNGCIPHGPRTGRLWLGPAACRAVPLRTNRNRHRNRHRCFDWQGRGFDKLGTNDPPLGWAGTPRARRRRHAHGDAPPNRRLPAYGRACALWKLGAARWRQATVVIRRRAAEPMSARASPSPPWAATSGLKTAVPCPVLHPSLPNAPLRFNWCCTIRFMVPKAGRTQASRRIASARWPLVRRSRRGPADRFRKRARARPGRGNKNSGIAVPMVLTLPFPRVAGGKERASDPARRRRCSARPDGWPRPVTLRRAPGNSRSV